MAILFDNNQIVKTKISFFVKAPWLTHHDQGPVIVPAAHARADQVGDRDPELDAAEGSGVRKPQGTTTNGLNIAIQSVRDDITEQRCPGKPH